MLVNVMAVRTTSKCAIFVDCPWLNRLPMRWYYICLPPSHVFPSPSLPSPPQENLRKHVINTRCHPGLCLYMCSFCPPDGESQFGTNFAREFKQHLRGQHGDQFETGSAVATYVTGRYNREDDVIETETPIDHTYKER